MEQPVESLPLPTCMYCRLPIEDGDMEMKSIFSPNWRSSGGKSPLRDYHRSKGCHMKDQMGHEG